ncbi:MAG: polysaccharide pyruvyl transferase family protein [Opitutus sp.]|nr:polysaccharide pyruvyl transferase family protein [Opitutus sp.]
MLPITRKTALLLNFTGNVYHWGCYGTSTEIYLSLVERGYSVTWLSVRYSRSCRPVPTNLAEFQSEEFRERFLKKNRALHHALKETDVVVVNGEGTLHGRENEAPRNLLYLMFLAATVYRKPVHLINHSFFPADHDVPDATADLLYQTVASKLTAIVARDPISCRILRRLGVSHVQSFDCLPRFLQRHDFRPGTSPSGPVVVSGGVSLSEKAGAAEAVAQALRPAIEARREIVFLAGAKGQPDKGDRRCYEAFLARVPTMQWHEARSMESWVEAIRTSACLVSGRFHHSIAAMALGTPFVVFPSNTSKVEGICELVGMPPPIPYADPQFAEKIEDAVRRALSGDLPATTPEMRAHMVEWGARNFEGL